VSPPQAAHGGGRGAPYHVAIIGGGGTGAALAHDLALRGLRVTLLERGEVVSGTTGRHHGLLHSGARYAVGDPESAVECIQENRILRRIALGSFEENDGLFVAVTDEDADFAPTFLEACRTCGIPAERLEPAEALRLEPGLNPQLRLAVRVPDATMDAMRLPLRFLATALAHGAVVLPFHLVTGLRCQGKTVTGVVATDLTSGRPVEVGADIVVNAAGPWCGQIAAMAGAEVPIQPSPGVLVALWGRLCQMVVNRLHRAGDGDIVVPQRALSIVGTSSWLVDDPDDLDVPHEHVDLMRREGARLIPAVARAPIRATWAAARPLIGQRRRNPSPGAPDVPAGPVARPGSGTAAAGGSGAPGLGTPRPAEGESAPPASGRELSRTFRCFDHAVEDGVEGLVTIAGGKATTLRAMAEATADLVCRKLDLDAPCRTRETPLLPHTAYYALQAARMAS
jgi:glycerol-3-phosphate dehydrogenase